jgi:hypothetical protein
VKSIFSGYLFSTLFRLILLTTYYVILTDAYLLLQSATARFIRCVATTNIILRFKQDSVEKAGDVKSSPEISVTEICL